MRTTNKADQTTYSQKRVKQLQQRSQKIAMIFNANNFYEGEHINVNKLKQKIQQAKRKLLDDKQQHNRSNSFNPTQKQQKNGKNNRNNNTRKDNHNYTTINANKDSSFNNRHGNSNDKRDSSSRDIQFQPRKEKLQKAGNTRQINYSIAHNNNNKSRITNANQRIKRLVTDLGDYSISRKQTNQTNINNINQNNDLLTYIQPISRMRTISNNYNNQQDTRHMRFSSIETPTGKNSYSALSVQISHNKIILSTKQHLQEFQMKIYILWELYENIIQMMQHASKSNIINQKLVQKYVKSVTSNKYQFVHDIYDIFKDNRIQKTIKMSRVLQNISVFQMCLSYNNSPSPKKKFIQSSSTQIINYLGYSSSSIIFLIKILLLTHQTSFIFSQNIKNIISSIRQFQTNSYKQQLRNIKQVLRRLEHNNQIIGLIKTRCGKKHGKYCEQFINKIMKSVQKTMEKYGADKQKISFFQFANNIFEFLAFYIHYENLAKYYSILAVPPSPFLSLRYSKTIIIQPWGVLAFRRNNKLVIRAHTGKFLAQVSDNCNVIFWTQLMPKDAQILTNLLPVKENIYWLYRYHCKQERENLVKVVDLVGCIPQNCIIIDSDQENFAYNLDIGINLIWRGQKKDVKLLTLSEIIQKIFQQSNLNKTTLKQQLYKMRPQIHNLMSPKRSPGNKSKGKSY